MPWVNKHLMTGPKENSEFCFPENVPRGEAEGNIEGLGETKLTFPPWGQSLSVLLPPNSK